MVDNEAEHVVIVAETGAVKCLHCGEQFRIDYPAPADKVLSYMEAFTWLHTTCEKQDETDH